MAYNDIDSGKVLNKEGLLELCNQIKTEIANNSGGGGSSYTAGGGISIDANNVISTITPQMLFYDGGMGWNRSSNTKEQIIERLKRGEVVYNPSSSITIQASELIPSGRIRILGPINNNTGLINNTTSNSITLHNDYYYYLIKGQRTTVSSYETGGVVLVSSNGDFYNLIPYYDGTLNPQKTSQYLHLNKQDKLTAGTGISISNNVISSTVEGLPSAPTTDGTYTLQCVVSSGTSTYSWVAVS